VHHLTPKNGRSISCVIKQMSTERSNLDHLQTLEMIEQSSFGRAQVDQKKSDDALDRNKRGAVAYFS
ncbi:hypothetical protein BgiMline_002270, partial [Biomphalaria glabrata]